MNETHEIEKDMHYLQLLATTFPTIADAATEIINLSAILNLPKGTEHFLADIHGEHEAFLHIIKNASGNIKRKVTELFGNTLRESEIKELCTLIYYPEQKLQLVKAQEKELDDWYHITLYQLVRVLREVSSKYTRSKVSKSLPDEFSFILRELLYEYHSDGAKVAYVNVIIDTIITTGRADDFIIATAKVIQRLSIDQLHILGDVYDRGPGAHIIMDYLSQYHSWDIQWGNHDILWMGASAGNDACICNVIRLSLRYANLTTLEDGYGINLMPLAAYAMENYNDDPCEAFRPILNSENSNRFDEKTLRLMAMMHKAIAILQFKAEAQIFQRNPQWQMLDRCQLGDIDYAKGTITLDGKEYQLTDTHFPSVDPANPLAFTEEEKTIMKRLHHSFRVSEKLQRHISTILSHGCMYAIFNSNLLFHASVPLNEDGSFSKTQEVKIGEGEGAVTRTYSLTGKIEITSQTTGSGADEQFIQNMKITLNDVSSFPENTQININYSAKVKRTAKIGVSGNQNTAKVTYSSNPLNLSETKTSTEVHTKTYCLELDLIKVVSETGAPLTGSQWRVYELDKKTATYSILVADTSVSTSNQDKPQISITDNQFFIKGLGTGAYQLVETVAPNGYSPIKTPIEFSVLIPDDTEEVTYNNSFANLTPKWVSNSAVRTFDTTKLTSEGKVQITINNGTNPPLPSTGGAGLYIVAGVAIVALLGFGGTAMIKRKVNGGE